MDGFDLDIGMPGPGRRPSPVILGESRPLKEPDLAALASPGESKPPEIKRLMERHHALAKHLAAGMAPGEAGILVGYSASRVSILKASPMFQELVEFYSKEIDQKFDAILENLAGLSHDAIIELRDRLEDEEQLAKISIGQLMELAKLGADRTGRGPTQTVNTNVTHNMGERLAKAMQRAREAKGLIRPEDAIDVTPDE